LKDWPSGSVSLYVITHLGVRRLWPVLALGWLAGAAGAAFASLALVREANTTLRRPLDRSENFT
jgi:hypothetical protein